MIRDYYNDTRTYRELLDLEREAFGHEINYKVVDRMKALSMQYRRDVLKVSPKYKKEGMIVWSYLDKEVLAYIGHEFHFHITEEYMFLYDIY